jgi:hypothetical protein
VVVDVPELGVALQALAFRECMASIQPCLTRTNVCVPCGVGG